MTIKELKEKISTLDDDMKVGGVGHYGDFLECFDANVQEINIEIFPIKKETIFALYIESAGEEPD